MYTAIAWERPIFFRRNRVFRVYKGGYLFHDFLGDPAEDGFEPEEWICSSVRAINPGHTDPLEGISICESGAPFSALLEAHPKELLGDRKDLGVLVKYLDSAIRLPMQVHPTRAFSRENFHSPYGKAESWLILATRPDACLYLGFSREVSPQEFSAAVEESERNKECMTAFVNRVPVRTGDVFFVNAGVIHAIGAGCLILEVQEPTDFTIQPEYWCGEYHLNSQEMYLGLPKEKALECFDFTLFGQQVVDQARKTPKLLWETPSVRVEQLIGEEDTPCFSMTRYHLTDGELVLSEPASIWICTEGSGTVTAGGARRKLKKGDYFFLPAAAVGKCTVNSKKIIQIVCCKGGK